MFSLFWSSTKSDSLKTDSSYSETFQSEVQQSDSNDYDVVPICNIVSRDTIVSNASRTGSAIKYEQGSFTLCRTSDDCISLRFHPIFLWRLVIFEQTKKNDKEIINFTRLQTFVSKFMRKRGFDICIDVSDCDIRYIMDDTIVVKPVSRFVYDNLLMLFNKLHMSITRNYNSFDSVDAMLEYCFQVVRIISGV
jgi:hypothetical protein